MKKIWKRIGFVAVSSLLVSLFAACKKNSFDPSNNAAECIYGPPEMFEDEVSENDVSGEEFGVFDPELNENICIYGPPEMFEDSTISK